MCLYGFPVLYGTSFQIFSFNSANISPSAHDGAAFNCELLLVGVVAVLEAVMSVTTGKEQLAWPMVVIKAEDALLDSVWVILVAIVYLGCDTCVQLA